MRESIPITRSSCKGGDIDAMRRLLLFAGCFRGTLPPDVSARRRGGTMQQAVPEAPAVPVVVGWRELVALPGLAIGPLRAKIDTGARSSSLHVDAQWRFVERGAPWVGFRLQPRRRFPRVCEAAAPIHDEREVGDSGGHRTRRVFILTPLQLAQRERLAEINLTDRGGMLFPLLVGRTALQGAFTVDPSRSFVHGRRLGGREQGTGKA